MAKFYDRIEPPIARFIEKQKIFFTATATADSRVNISPRSTDALRILDDRRVCYLDLTGSGSETSAHLLADGRMTIMVCAFEGPPMIARLFGRGRSLFHGTPEYAERLAASYGGEAPLGARQIVVLEADLAQTSCGYAVPLFDHAGERDVLTKWAEGKGAEGLTAYRAEKNAVSIDGLPTGMPA